MATATSRTVFVLGQEADGNREVVVVESGDTYEFEYDTISTYTAGAASFPYSA